MKRSLPYILSILTLGASINFGLTQSANAEITTPEDKALQQVHMHFPERLQDIEQNCQDKMLQTQLNGAGTRLSFICWEPDQPDFRQNSQDLIGEYLGTLPLSPDDQTFKVEPLKCYGDPSCQQIFDRLRQESPERLKAAEFHCATLSGSLFMTQIDQELDLRCGFMRTLLFDEQGNGTIDHEDPVSVDFSVLKVNMASLR